MQTSCNQLLHASTKSLRRQERDNLIVYYYEQCTHHYGSPLPFTVDNLHRAYNFVLPFEAVLYLMSLTMIINGDGIVGPVGHPLRLQRRQALIDRAKAIIDDCLDDNSIRESVQKILG